MLKRAVVFVMLLSVCASQEEPQADASIMFMVEGAEQKGDYRTFDYCALNCKDAKHSACKCKMRPPRTFDDKDLVKFRQETLDYHNELRNKIASGNESTPSFHGKTASNMMVLNYDLELEYIAKCYGGYYVYGHDSCRSTIDKGFVGQNLAGNGALLSNAHFLNMERWYNEVQLIDNPNYVFPKLNETTVGKMTLLHFTQFIWATASHVGCARVWNPKNYADNSAWKHTMLCNYRALGGKFMNYKQGYIFKLGEPCSDCPSGMKCNDNYTSLCGELELVPTDPGRAKGSERLVPSRIVSLCALVVLLYFC